jgi:hypothetical protein
MLYIKAMLYIFGGCAAVVLIVGGLFLLSKSNDPVEEKKDADDREQSSERIDLEYTPFWKKEIEL